MLHLERKFRSLNVFLLSTKNSWSAPTELFDRRGRAQLLLLLKRCPLVPQNVFIFPHGSLDRNIQGSNVNWQALRYIQGVKTQGRTTAACDMDRVDQKWQQLSKTAGGQEAKPPTTFDEITDDSASRVYIQNTRSTKRSLRYLQIKTKSLQTQQGFYISPVLFPVRLFLHPGVQCWLVLRICFKRHKRAGGTLFCQHPHLIREWYLIREQYVLVCLK